MPAKHSERGKGRALRIVVLIALGAAALFLLLGQNLSQTMMDLAYARAYALAVETVNRAVEETMHGVTYDELVLTRMDQQGHVTMLNANSTRMNELATQTALLAQSRLDQVENEYVQVPLGSAFGVKFLAGVGPRVSFKIVPVGSVGTEFETEYEAAGVNQTRHKITMRIKTTVRLVVPSGTQRVDVVSRVPIAESLIVGLVPDTFIDVANQDDMLNLIP